MLTRFFTVFCFLFFFCFNFSVAIADNEVVSESTGGDSLRVAVVNDGQNENLRKWLDEIKPEAGVEEIDSPKRLKYWQQKVVGRNRRAVSN